MAWEMAKNIKYFFVFIPFKFRLYYNLIIYIWMNSCKTWRLIVFTSKLFYEDFLPWKINCTRFNFTQIFGLVLLNLLIRLGGINSLAFKCTLHESIYTRTNREIIISYMEVSKPERVNSDYTNMDLTHVGSEAFIS